MPMKITIQPATPERWDDLARLFGPTGACAGCWCMFFRMPRAEWRAGQGASNRRALRRIVRDGELPGVLAYSGDQAIGWCAIQPRDAYPTLIDRYPPIDDRPVWSITCFYVHKAHRGQGVMRTLLDGALAHARRAGAGVVEAYPSDPGDRRIGSTDAYMGVRPMFEAAGFAEVGHTPRGKPIMRRTLRGGRAARRRAPE